MSVNLSITDNQDGTVTATVSGTDQTATNVISTVPVVGDQNWLAQPWTNQATITGNGVTTITLTKGYYWFICASTLASSTTVSFPVYAACTDGQDDVYERCIAATLARLNLMSFVGDETDSPVGIQLINDGIIPVDQMLPFPRLEISVEGEAEEQMDMGVNTRDDYWMGVKITIVDANNSGEYKTKRKKILRWRRQIAAAFAFYRPDSVPECLKTVVRFGPTFDARVFENQYIVSGLTARYMLRLPRGLFPN